MKITNFYKILLIVATVFIVFPVANMYAADNVAVIASPGSCDLLQHPLECVSNGIINTIINIAGILAPAALRIGEYFLNAAISGDVLGAGFTPDSNEYIATGWGIVRNLANAALVIGLVVIAVSIILGYQENQAKKILLNFIIIALLINFTPVICGFIIDGANILTKSMMTGGIDDSYSKSISNLFVIIGNMKGGWIDQLALTIVVTFFSLFATVIYLLYALLFFGRIVILWILVIVSPIAFATKVFPQSKYIRNFFPSITYWDDWWESFIQWCVIGIPAGMSIYLSNAMIVKIASTSNSTAATEANIFGILIGYSVPFIFLLAGFFISISSGGKVGAFVGGVGAGAWAMSGAKAIDRIRGGAERGWTVTKEGAAGTIGAATALKNPISFENREEGRRSIDKSLTFGAPNPRDDKEGAQNYMKRHPRAYDFKTRENLRREELNKDVGDYLDTAKTPDELKSRIGDVEALGSEKTKGNAALKIAGKRDVDGGDDIYKKFVTTNNIKIENKISGMSNRVAQKELDEKVLANYDIFKEMNVEQIDYIMKHGSESQKKSLSSNFGGGNSDFKAHMKDLNIRANDPNNPDPESKKEFEKSRENVLAIINNKKP
jgi:hypothetical protein